MKSKVRLVLERNERCKFQLKLKDESGEDLGHAFGTFFLQEAIGDILPTENLIILDCKLSYGEWEDTP